MTQNIIFIITVALTSSIVFAFIDASFFLIAEKSVEDKLSKNKYLDENTTQIATGAISASIAIFFASLISKFLSNKFNIISNPFIDSAGILLGTILFIMIYNIFIKSKLKKN